MNKYKDQNLSPRERAEDLCALMNLEEKIAQLSGYMPFALLDSELAVDPQKAEAIAKHGLGRLTQFAGISAIDPRKIVKAYNTIQKYCVEQTRLGIPFMTQAECINGLVAPYGAPFPCPTVVASTFNPEMARLVGKSIGEQNAAAGVNIGLFPTVDLSRDARWGRITENFGEDAYLTAVMASTEAKEYQKNPKLMCTAKHFVGFGQVIEGQYSAEIMVPEHTLREDHAYPWETMFRESDVRGVMCTYGLWNGVPASVSKELLTGLLKEELGFQGSAICDGNSITQAHELNYVGDNVAHTAALAVKAGLGADTPTPKYFPHLREAVEQGYITEAEIDHRVVEILEQKFRLGLFEAPYFDESKVSETLIKGRYDEDCKAVLREGITLLQNKEHFLPLEKTSDHIAVIGPFGDSFKDFFGGYTFPTYARMMWGIVKKQEKGKMQGVTDANAIGDASYGATFGNMFNGMPDEWQRRLVDEDLKDIICDEMYNGETIVQAIERQTGRKPSFAKGTNFSSVHESYENALNLAGNADIVVLALGENVGWGEDSLGGEGNTRTFCLPENQEKLLKEVIRRNENVILVLIAGRPLVLPEEALQAKAIFNMWMPSAFGGTCLSEILFGAVNPSGRLPVTMPLSLKNTQSYYAQIPGKRSPQGDGFDEVQRWPFGYGLSYTDFEYSDLRIDETTPIDGNVTISVKVTNTGHRTGKEVCEVYFQLKNRTVSRPIRQLVAFEKVELVPGQTAEIKFHIPVDIVGYYNMDHIFGIERGPVEIYVGGDSEHCALHGKTEVVGDFRTLDYHRKHISHSEVSIIN